MGLKRDLRAYGLAFRSHNANSLTAFLDSGATIASSIHFVAASTITTTRNKRVFAQTLEKGILIADSRALIAYLNLKFGKFEGVRGTDFMRHYLGEGSKKYFLIGTNSSTTTKLIKKISFANPNAICVGVINPDYKEHFENDIPKWINSISESGAKSVWVGMGSPKQDIIADNLSQNLTLPAIAVGAAFDFIAETKLEAPKLFQVLMLEWLFRLFSEIGRAHV